MSTKINVKDRGSIGKISTTEKGDIIHGKRNSPWNNGIFYLLVMIVILASIATIGKLFPFYILPVIILGALLLFLVVGAFQLVQDESISEKNFMKLMGMTIKTIPLLFKKKNN